VFTNYLKIALRNLKRHKSFSFINIIGLAVGITCFITLFLFILDELNYDTFHENADQIYRVYVHQNINNQESCNSKTAAPLGATLQRDFPEVITYTRLGYAGSHVLRYNDKVFREWRVYTADSTYFSIFKFKFVEGDPKTALVEPNSIVLTETSARKYFGDENPVGKTLSVNDKSSYLITGLIKDFPKNAHFHCDFLLSMSTYPITESQYWLDLWYSTYIVLQKGAYPAEFEKKLEKTVFDYVGPQAQAILGVPIQQFLEKGNQYSYHLQPLKSIYLHSKRKYGIDPNTEWGQVRSSDIAYTYIFSAVAIFILLIAVINFMNLATARSERRSKEVGIRKTPGTSKYRLVWQFIIESILMTAFAVFLAGMLLKLVLPGFNHLSGKELNLEFFNNSFTIPLLAIFTILIGTLAGSYPAFYLSSFRPGQILKASSGRSTRKSALRSVLVIIQFAISITLIIGTIIIRNQLHYIQNKNLGFNKEHLLSINNAGVLGNKIEVFKQELLKNSNIISLTNSSRMFNTGIPGNGYLYNKKNRHGSELLSISGCGLRFFRNASN
jgi:putative ABC transport system permease protein